MQAHLQVVNVKRMENGYYPLPYNADMVVLFDPRAQLVGGQSRPPSPSSDLIPSRQSAGRRFRIPLPVQSSHSSRHRSHWPGMRPRSVSHAPEAGLRLSSHSFGWFQNARERVLNDVCGICQEDFIEDERIVDLACQHFYHERCLEKWFDFQLQNGKNAACPLCKRKHDS